MLVTALLLLVVSMVATSEPHHGLAVDRYRFSHAMPMPGALRFDAMKVMIARDGAIYFGNTRPASGDLSDQIRQRVQNSTERKLYIVVDPRARYANLSVVLDEARRAGVWEVAFLAESPLIHR